MQYLSSLNSNSKERKLWNKIIKIKNFNNYIPEDLDKHLIGIDLAVKKSNDYLFTLDKIDDVYIYEAAGYYIFATSNKITLEDVELSLLYYNFSYLVNTWFYPYKSDNQLEMMSTILKPLVVDSKFNRNLEYICNLFENSKENLELLQLVTQATQATSPEEFLHKILEILMLVQREGTRWSNDVSENINKILIKSFYYFLIDSKYNYDRKFLIKKCFKLEIEDIDPKVSFKYSIYKKI